MPKIFEPHWTPEQYRSRPSEYDPLLCEQICARVSNGETLTTICRDRDMPLPATFLRWVNKDPLLAEDWATALRVRTDIQMEQMIDASELMDPRQAKNEIDVRRFHVERMNPDKYGPRSQVTTLNTNAENSVAGGIDYGADVRRRIEQMAARAAETTAPASPE